MDLSSIFKQNACAVNIKAKDKESAINALAALAPQSGKTGRFSRKMIATALSNREAQGSTAFGGEIAIPHARIPGMEEFILYVAQCPKGVDFNSLDKKKVKLFFVILGPAERPSEHVQILAGISRILSGTSLKKELLSATSKDVMGESFLRHAGDKHEAVNKEKQKLKLLILILYLDEFLYHIMEYFLEEGIEGATIVESSGMGRYVSNIPLFATFIGFMNEQKNRSNTILATIPADRETEIIRGIEAITGDLDKKQGAMLMTMDIAVWKGTMKMM